MLRLAIRRIAAAVPVMLIVATVTFFLVDLVPGDPAYYLLGTGATPAQLADLRAQLGLDDPLAQRYIEWLGNAVTGDLGTSIISQEPVVTRLGRALPPTLSVAVLATLLSVVVGIVLGMIAAIRGGKVDRVVHAFCSLTMAVPNFWLAAGLVSALAIKIQVFPATGYVGLTESPWEWALHLVLPTIAVGLGFMAQVAFQTRSAFLDALGRDYVRTLAAAGVRRWRILGKHVLRNAAVPVATIASLGFVFTLGGVVVIEAIFNLPGMGALMLRSVGNHDIVVVQGVVLVFSLLVVAANVLADLTVAALDPRVRIR